MLPAKATNEINKIYREVTTYGHKWPIPIDEIEKRYVKRTGGKSIFLDKFKGMTTVSEATFASTMSSHTSSIGEAVKAHVKKADLWQKAEMFLGKTKSAVKLMPSEMSVLDDAIRYLDETTTRYGKMMNNRGSLAALKDATIGLKAWVLNMSESLPSGKTYFNFHTAEDFEWFVKKAKYLSKKSPETLCRLIQVLSVRR